MPNYKQKDQTGYPTSKDNRVILPVVKWQFFLRDLFQKSTTRALNQYVNEYHYHITEKAFEDAINEAINKHKELNDE
jgi:hypothetical protein